MIRILDFSKHNRYADGKQLQVPGEYVKVSTVYSNTNEYILGHAECIFNTVRQTHDEPKKSG